MGKHFFLLLTIFVLYQGTSRATCVQFAKEEGILLDFAVHRAHSTKKQYFDKKIVFLLFFPSKRKKRLCICVFSLFREIVRCFLLNRQILGESDLYCF